MLQRRAISQPSPISISLIFARWHEAFGIEPLAHLSREVLIAALSYHAQEQMAGGPAKQVERRLEKLAAELAATGAVKVAAEVAIRPGTRLMR